MPPGCRLYRLALKLYPARFREEYGAPLERQFLDEYREADGMAARAMFWVRLVRDLLFSVPREVLREIRLDLRHSFRVYRSRPLITLLALVSLTLAIGATTGVFSVVNALLLRSLPIRDAERLARLAVYSPTGLGDRAAFHEWRLHNEYFEDAATYDSGEMTMSRANGASRARVTETSANFFAVAGGDPRIGRGFTAGEDVAGRNTVAVIGYGLWQQMFGGDPRTLNSTIRINGTPVTIVGIAPPGFDYPARTVIWTPTAFDPERIPKVDMTMWWTFGRLKPGLTFTEAQRRLETEVARTDPDALKPAKGPLAGFDNFPRLIPLRDELAGPVRRASLALMGAVVFVLLIACSNVANLLLTRVTDRRQELVIRSALGASRARLVQQLITESVMLSAVAGICGMGVAVWAARLATHAQPAQIAAQEYAVLEWRVLAFAIGTAAATGLVFGVIPAWLVGRLQPAADLVHNQPGSGGRRSGGMRAGLVVVQVALTLVLVAGAITMGRGFARLAADDLGFHSTGVVTMRVSLAGTPAAATDRGVPQYYTEALERLRAIPGVESAGAVSDLPLATTGFSAGLFTIDQGAETLAVVTTVSPDYFRAMRTELLAGRDFLPGDSKDAGAEVAIVNDEFARRASGGNVVGGQLKSRMSKRGPLTIVGVARRTRYLPSLTHDTTAQVFLPLGQRAPKSMTFVVRVRGNADGYVAMCRDVVGAIDRQVPVFDVKTLDEHLATSLARPRFYTSVVLFFSGFALLLAVMGVYGVAAYSVARRTHEIGVRMALGSSPSALRALLARGSLLAVLAGMLGGIAASMAMARVVAHFLPGSEISVGVCAGAAVLLGVTALGAVWWATNRVARIQPLDVLRAE